MASVELAVIGAGPAGLAAAASAARAGVRVTLIDEYTSPGGQYLKGASHATQSPHSFPAERQGRALLRQVAELDVDLRLETLVWGIEGRRLALHGPRGLDWLEVETLVVAAGARELAIPFPGWTLPGVMAVGAAQILAKAYGVLPGRRVLLAGSGPLLLAAACELIEQGAQVVAVLEASHFTRWLPYAPVVWGQWDRLREGWHYLRALRRARVPYRLGWTVVEALGRDEVEAAIVARVDGEGRPLPNSEQKLDVDTVCLGFGFVPNLELTLLAGCAHAYDPARGGWVPQVNERMETTVAGLFVTGETAGIGGAAAAMLEGRLAGLSAAQRLGRLDEDELRREVAGLARQRRRLGRFAAMLNTLFVPGPGLDSITSGDTVICRCEEVTAGDVREAVAQGACELDALKTGTRVGQGPCQGRTCGPLLARLVAHETGRSIQEAGLFHVRPPLKPIPMGDLAGEGGL